MIDFSSSWSRFSSFAFMASSSCYRLAARFSASIHLAFKSLTCLSSFLYAEFWSKFEDRSWCLKDSKACSNFYMLARGINDLQKWSSHVSDSESWAESSLFPASRFQGGPRFALLILKSVPLSASYTWCQLDFPLWDRFQDVCQAARIQLSAASHWQPATCQPACTRPIEAYVRLRPSCQSSSSSK